MVHILLGVYLTCGVIGYGLKLTYYIRLKYFNTVKTNYIICVYSLILFSKVWMSTFLMRKMIKTLLYSLKPSNFAPVKLLI